MQNPVTDRITDGVAVAAVSSPIWLQQLSDASSLLLPILGALWLVVQIAGYLRNVINENRRKT